MIVYNIDSVCSINGSSEMGEIFISDGKCVTDKVLLKKLNITHILNAAETEIRTGKYFYKNNNIKYLGIAVLDTPNENISLYFDRVADFIHNCLINRGKIIVHCVMGISRSSTCVIAYLIKYCNMDVFDAIKFLKKKRSIINPNVGFIKQLQQFQERFINI